MQLVVYNGLGGHNHHVTSNVCMWLQDYAYGCESEYFRYLHMSMRDSGVAKASPGQAYDRPVLGRGPPPPPQFLLYMRTQLMASSNA